MKGDIIGWIRHTLNTGISLVILAALVYLVYALWSKTVDYLGTSWGVIAVMACIVVFGTALGYIGTNTILKKLGLE